LAYTGTNKIAATNKASAMLQSTIAYQLLPGILGFPPQAGPDSAPAVPDAIGLKLDEDNPETVTEGSGC
jgi:hypothetical protein